MRLKLMKPKHETYNSDRERFRGDQRLKCHTCKQVLFLSGVYCPCSPTKAYCGIHTGDLCLCSQSKRTLFVRLSLLELEALCDRVTQMCEPLPSTVLDDAHAKAVAELAPLRAHLGLECSSFVSQEFGSLATKWIAKVDAALKAKVTIDEAHRYSFA